MNDFDRLTEEVGEWHHRNFPSSSALDVFLVLVEEVGELSQAIVKPRDGIRGNAAKWEAEERDAIGDITIALAGYCARRGWSLGDLVMATWNKVRQRDWIADPERGGRDDL